MADAKGDLEAALAQGARLLETAPARAADQAAEILRIVNDEPRALVLLGAAHRRTGDVAAAVESLGRAVARAPTLAEAHFELSLAEAAAGRSKSALRSMQKALGAKPGILNAWRALGDEFLKAGDAEAAGDAFARHVGATAKDPELIAAADALNRGDIPIAERQLKNYLKRAPTDVAAIRMLAELAARIGRLNDSENLLARAVQLAPDFRAARHHLAIVRLRLGKAEEAAAEAESLLKAEPGNPSLLTLHGAALARIGEFARAIEIYDRLLKSHPRQARTWMSYGHALKTVGRREESIAAYRKSLAVAPHLGESWWSLANLKTVRFTDDDVAVMEKALAENNLDDEDRFHLHFALGKALEDRAAYEASFRHYNAGNALRQPQLGYDEDQMEVRAARMTALLTPALFAGREGHGCPAPDPIFVLGMPRAGSTLIEQILASHSQIEGTMELPDIISMAQRLGGKRGENYPACLERLSADELRSLGEEYLQRTRVQRKTGKPRFIDKMPNNFQHVGFIRLILPNARIIDARRHPLACCFSNFKQHFAKGQGFTYGLERVGKYYREYAALMAAFDAAAPGAVHRVIYERMVADTEAEVRSLLAYCGVPFEPQCLKFYETDRPVRTASSEQVRQPIFSEGVDQWRHYEAWLGPLKQALGPVLDAYPDAPEAF
jgi:tetratricopeptide (TPR) repeat protein